MKTATLLPVALLLATASLSGCQTAGVDAKAMVEEALSVEDDGRTRVEVATVQPSQARLTLELPGEIAGSEDALLAAAEGGLVEAVHVDDGDRVRKGQRLVDLDRSVVSAQLAQATAQREQAEADLARLERLGDLAVEQALLQARTQVRSAEANETVLKVRVARATITAPFSGVVGSVAVEEGEYAQVGAPVVRLVKLDPVIASLPVSDRDVVALTEGMEARVRTGASGVILKGTVRHISPVADLSTRSFMVEVEVPNPDRRLLPGMIARVEVERVVGEDRIVVPQDWLVTRGESYGLFVVVDGIARWVPTTIEEIVANRVVLGDGIEPGARVILTGQHDLVEGDPVRIAREGVCCEHGRPVFDGVTAANRP